MYVYIYICLHLHLPISISPSPSLSHYLCHLYDCCIFLRAVESIRAEVTSPTVRCYECQRPVLPVERVMFQGKPFHRECAFRRKVREDKEPARLLKGERMIMDMKLPCDGVSMMMCVYDGV